MTYIDHDLGPDGPSRAPAKPVTTQRTEAGAQPPLLDLQRLAGNAAVSRAIRGGQFDSSLPVQRVEAEEQEDEDSDGYANDEEMAGEAEEQAEETEEAEAYGETEDNSSGGTEGYANEEEESEEAEDEAEDAEEAEAYGESPEGAGEEESEEESEEDLASL